MGGYFWVTGGTGKKTPGFLGEPGHTRDTRDTRARTKANGPHRRTSQPSKPTNNTHPARQRDDRSRGRLNSRRPGADRSPRPTQKRPPPANPTLTVVRTVCVPAPPVSYRYYKDGGSPVQCYNGFASALVRCHGDADIDPSLKGGGGDPQYLRGERTAAAPAQCALTIIGFHHSTA